MRQGIAGTGQQPWLGRWALCAVFLLALAPRLALTVAYLRTPIGLDDMYQYDMLARSISSGKGYRWYQRRDVVFLQPYLQRFYDIDLSADEVPLDGYLTTFRAPGYPFFLAGLYAVSGVASRVAVARVVQAFLTATLAPLTALLALHLGLSRRPAIFSAVAVGLYPILWIYPLGLGSENLFIPLLLGSALLLLITTQRQTRMISIATGAVLAAAILTRPALVLFLPLAGLWVWRAAGRRASVLIMVTTIAGLMPWMIRNSLILGHPAFVENTLGYNLFVGYHPQGDGGFVNEIGVIPTRFLDDTERGQWTTLQALGFIRADPGRVPSLLVRRMVYFWGLEDRELIYFYANDYFGPIPQPWLTVAYALLVVPLILIGLSTPWGLALAGSSPGRSLVFALVGATLLAYIPVLAEPRFHLPLIPFMAVYASTAWSTPGFFRQVAARLLGRHPAFWFAALACALLIVVWISDVRAEWPRLTAVFSAGGNRLWLNY
ncbi:MAG: hypothetical protein A2Z37_11380 [Chloroflexi bacterium RBG_19FT_COMBO_62_14]|nr:MAG: hypothetical protein A2Z37_11380 [Chloroflexi bacterium RBG_19FT_COMBO_62_14]